MMEFVCVECGHEPAPDAITCPLCSGDLKALGYE